ncbi:hypothetical protein [Paenibacillus sanfengchensis]|uniref:hypothetical protein n=1 Tax=Paenibacillus sanfengchensis TaxID=3119819 RepID=UPI002FE2B4A7
MGLDYSYVLVMRKDKRDELFHFVKEHGKVDRPDCFRAYLELDSHVLKYLEGGYDWKPHYDKDEIQQYLLPDNRAWIGGIDYDERIPHANAEELVVRFTAVTSDMSRLFEDSMSVRSWFVALSKEVDARITYLDLESEGHRIIYLNGAETFLELKRDGIYHVSKHNFRQMMDEFVKHLPGILTSYETSYKFEEEYTLIIKKTHMDKLRNYIERHGYFDNSQVVLKFDLDSTLMKYLEEGHGEQEYGIAQGVVPHFRKDIIYKYIEQGYKVKIEKIEYLVEELSGEEDMVKVRLIPKKWKTDQLFSQSISIRKWFEDLSKEVSAKMTYQSLWNGGYAHRIIYYEGEQTNMEFTGHYELDVNCFTEIYRHFAMYFEHFHE